MRPEQHVIDTRAVRQVRSALPPEWVDRDLTSQDYGIDLAVELFEGGAATGSLLLLQIKGTQEPVKDTGVEPVSFDAPVKLIKYAELFSVPILLCRVHVGGTGFDFVWLQEYQSVVLDFEKPAWRKNKRSTRICIPPGNRLPGGEDRLRAIAARPRIRQELVRLFGLIHEMHWAVAPFQNIVDDEIDQESLTKFEDLVQQAAGLHALFDAPTSWARTFRPTYIERTLTMIDEIRRRAGAAPNLSNGPGSIASLLPWQVQGLSAAASQIDDSSLKHTLWATERRHEF